MATEHRLTSALRDLLNQQRNAALGTVGPSGAPFVSLVPYAVDTRQRCLVIHVSALASHTGNLQREPRVSMLVSESAVEGEPVHALPRASLEATAELLAPHTHEALACQTVYLLRFPEAALMTELSDFRFVRLQVHAVRQVAGFGAARSLDREEVRTALGPAP
ncbi:MAG: pyridoxamine 5'-phosphate oxidase family protein [Hydrogenophaga sp.]|uniref:HugZ family pyridoxamine 5'-phosphate oxidase n=1 Tax=Hydrogenophaga sp. TaxID=1904254 RepID=UPI0027797D9C|nr:pyridoxamine 5'-phosphate oxidase family protein [Hydrogenophaga sp.]MDP2418767.1 pyridoxamine 5'-phosphate oxidase family protein [Hydrogenophaga sp.]MDZ4188049.1 pyridoxamine 5'-phosphate oxidase family protein [Hydrogenophaga sp.]